MQVLTSLPSVLLSHTLLFLDCHTLCGGLACCSKQTFLLLHRSRSSSSSDALGRRLVDARWNSAAILRSSLWRFCSNEVAVCNARLWRRLLPFGECRAKTPGLRRIHDVVNLQTSCVWMQVLKFLTLVWRNCLSSADDLSPEARRIVLRVVWHYPLLPPPSISTVGDTLDFSLMWRTIWEKDDPSAPLYDWYHCVRVALRVSPKTSEIELVSTHDNDYEAGTDHDYAPPVRQRCKLSTMDAKEIVEKLDAEPFMPRFKLFALHNPNHDSMYTDWGPTPDPAKLGVISLLKHFSGGGWALVYYQFCDQRLLEKNLRQNLAMTLETTSVHAARLLVPEQHLARVGTLRPHVAQQCHSTVTTIDAIHFSDEAIRCAIEFVQSADAAVEHTPPESKQDVKLHVKTAHRLGRSKTVAVAVQRCVRRAINCLLLPRVIQLEWCAALRCECLDTVSNVWRSMTSLPDLVERGRNYRRGHTYLSLEERARVKERLQTSPETLSCGHAMSKLWPMWAVDASLALVKPVTGLLLCALLEDERNEIRIQKLATDVQSRLAALMPHTRIATPPTPRSDDVLTTVINAFASSLCKVPAHDGLGWRSKNTQH